MNEFRWVRIPLLRPRQDGNPVHVDPTSGTAIMGGTTWSGPDHAVDENGFQVFTRGFSSGVSFFAVRVREAEELAKVGLSPLYPAGPRNPPLFEIVDTESEALALEEADRRTLAELASKHGVSNVFIGGTR